MQVLRIRASRRRKIGDFRENEVPDLRIDLPEESGQTGQQTLGSEGSIGGEDGRFVETVAVPAFHRMVMVPLGPGPGEGFLLLLFKIHELKTKEGTVVGLVPGVEVELVVAEQAAKPLGLLPERRELSQHPRIP